MKTLPPQFEELADLVWALVNDRLDAAGAMRLERLLDREAANRRVYLELMDQFASLEWEKGEGRGLAGKGRGLRGVERGLGTSVPSELVSDQWPVASESEIRNQKPETVSPESPAPEPLIPPIIIDASSPIRPFALQHPLAAGRLADLLRGGHVVDGHGDPGAWAYKVSHDYSPLAANNSRGLTAPGPDSPGTVGSQPIEPEFVGRITGTAECQWTDTKSAPVGRNVALGQAYALSSGLMEITYTTGAKVILQGPCTYEVESGRGGFLSLGRLTARMEKLSAISDQQSEIPNPKSQISKFVVRTPTAVVTDLGTEFGVEVDADGRTESHVFAGEVRIALVGDKGEPDQTATLRAGQTARCGRREGIVRPAAPTNAARFVRRIGPDLSNAVRIVEKFDGDKLGPAFEQMPPGRYRIGHGAAEYPHQDPPVHEWDSSRGYIRTVATDFCDRDFVFEATFQVELRPAEKYTERHYIFFGIGDGVPNPNYFEEISTGLALGFVVDNGRANVEYCHPDAGSTRSVTDPDAGNKIVAYVAPFRGLGPGRHRFRMWKTGKWVKFAVGRTSKGSSTRTSPAARSI